MASSESIGVCHRVAERFRGMINRKHWIQQYLAHTLQACSRSCGELAKRKRPALVSILVGCRALRCGEDPFTKTGVGLQSPCLPPFLSTCRCHWREICWDCSETKPQIPDRNCRETWKRETALRLAVLTALLGPEPGEEWAEGRQGPHW